MKKINLFLLLFCIAAAGTNNAYSFSVHKPATEPEQSAAVKYLSISQIINLSAKQFSGLTGKKMNLWNRLSFDIMKIKMKHELKKNPGLTLKEYIDDKPKHRLGAGWWILIGAAGALLLLFIVFIIAYGRQK